MSGNTLPQLSQLTEPLWTDSVLQSEISAHKLSSTLKKNCRQGMIHQTFPPNPCMWGKATIVFFAYCMCWLQVVLPKSCCRETTSRMACSLVLVSGAVWPPWTSVVRCQTSASLPSNRVSPSTILASVSTPCLLTGEWEWFCGCLGRWMGRSECVCGWNRVQYSSVPQPTELLGEGGGTCGMIQQRSSFSLGCNYG